MTSGISKDKEGRHLGHYQVWIPAEDRSHPAPFVTARAMAVARGFVDTGLHPGDILPPIGPSRGLDDIDEELTFLLSQQQSTTAAPLKRRLLDDPETVAAEVDYVSW
jgi:hypothetical protein